MKVLSINRLIKLFQCVLALVTIIFMVYGFSHVKPLKIAGHHYSVGRDNDSYDLVHRFGNLFVQIFLFLSIMGYILAVMMEYPQAYVLSPGVALACMVVPTKHPEEVLQDNSLMAFGITHVIISIILLLLLCFKPKTDSISTMKPINDDAGDDDHQVLIQI